MVPDSAGDLSACCRLCHHQTAPTATTVASTARMNGAFWLPPTLISGINTFRGTVPHAAVAEALAVEHTPYKA